MFGAVIILKKSFQKKLFQKKCQKALFKSKCVKRGRYQN